MKRILAFVLVLIMLLPLVACGETKEPQTTDAAVETAEKPKKTEEKKEEEKRELDRQILHKNSSQ